LFTSRSAYECVWVRLFKLFCGRTKSIFSQIRQASIPLPTNVKKKITGLREQRLPPPPFVSVYRHMPFYNDEEREWTEKNFIAILFFIWQKILLLNLNTHVGKLWLHKPPSRPTRRQQILWDTKHSWYSIPHSHCVYCRIQGAYVDVCFSWNDAAFNVFHFWSRDYGLLAFKCLFVVGKNRNHGQVCS